MSSPPLRLKVGYNHRTGRSLSAINKDIKAVGVPKGTGRRCMITAVFELGEDLDFDHWNSFLVKQKSPPVFIKGKLGLLVISR